MKQTKIALKNQQKGGTFKIDSETSIVISCGGAQIMKKLSKYTPDPSEIY